MRRKNKPKKLSSLSRKAQKALNLKALAQKEVDAAKERVDVIEVINQRLTALEVKAHTAALKGDKGERGEKGEKGSGFWG